MTSSAVVLLSGGMDSSTLLAQQVSKSRNVFALSVHYGQRHHKELMAARNIADHFKVNHLEVDLTTLLWIFEGSKSSQVTDTPVPHGSYDELSMKATVVPNRNMILLAVAQAYAISQGARYVAYAAHAGDHAIYPDCRPQFVQAMRVAFVSCDWNPASLTAPFINMSKADIVREGIKLKVPYEKTWTCYEGGDVACGRCGTCVERLEAFAIAKEEDPLQYVDREYWKTVVKA
jgi:7-cyano-7-deazaguanine synthase